MPADIPQSEAMNPPTTNLLQMILSGARTFGIGTIVAAFLLYEHFYVILPSHEENMRKQIEQCTQAVTAIAEEMKKMNSILQHLQLQHAIFSPLGDTEK